MIRRVLVVLAVVCAGAAAIGAWRVRGLPVAVPATGSVPSAAAGEVRVAYHVHTTRSDGTGTPDDVARAALEAGLDVVILTDHGDATRTPEPPRRVQGVLLIDGVEITTWGGHYVALGARPSPYPLGGEPAAVVEDVARLGGFGIAAHPGSNKDGLKWRAWDAPFDGLEWLNADSEWRDRPRDLWSAVFTYPWAPVPTLTALLNRPVAELQAWDRRTALAPAAGLAAHDAHARIGLGGLGEPYDGAVALRAPGYLPVFRTFSNVVQVDGATWGDDPARDATHLIAALKAGHTYTVVTGFGGSRVTRFEATSGGARAVMGGHLVPDGPVRFVAEVAAPESATTALVCDGRVVTSAHGGRLDWASAAPPGACRLEVRLADDPRAMPWVVTNPIYARATLQLASPSTVAPARGVWPLVGSGDAARWSAERAPGAEAVITRADASRPVVAFHWRLGGGNSEYAAIRFEAPGNLAQYDRLVLRARADRPMRIWVQLRSPAGGGRRWGRSVHLDASPVELTLPFATFLPIDGQPVQTLPAGEITALLLVADTVYARPGDSGTVTFDEWWIAR